MILYKKKLGSLRLQWLSAFVVLNKTRYQNKKKKQECSSTCTQINIVEKRYILKIKKVRLLITYTEINISLSSQPPPKKMLKIKDLIYLNVCKELKIKFQSRQNWFFTNLHTRPQFGRLLWYIQTGPRETKIRTSQKWPFWWPYPDQVKALLAFLVLEPRNRNKYLPIKVSKH